MSNALDTLKSIPQWICYKNEVKQEGDKPIKTPKNPHTGYNGSSTNPDSWSDFLTAVGAKKRYNMDGLGWVFTEDVGIVGIDLDDCIDDDGIKPWAQSIVDSIYSYTEVSPSGKGLHIFIYGMIAKALGPVPDSDIEIYARARYFTMTGNHVEGTPHTIATRQEAIDNLWKTESERRRESKKKEKPQTNNRQIASIQVTGDLSAYTEKAYIDEIAKLSATYDGCECRNDTLNRVAFNLGQFIEAGLLNRGDIESVLLSVSLQVGLDDVSARKTIQSGINSGIRSPRTNWPEPNRSQPELQEETIPEFDYELPTDADLIYHERVSEYLDFISGKWGLHQDTVNEFKLGYCDSCPTSPYSASITVPYYDIDSLVDIRHRLMSPNGQGVYRPEIENMPRRLFNIAAVSEDDWAIMVNREFNTMRVHQEHLPVIGLPKTFKRGWTSSLKELEMIYIALDPGMEKAAQAIGKMLVAEGIEARIASMPFSPVDMLNKYGCSIGDFCKFIKQSWVV